jgi:predicted GNAT family acetyltransferase
MNAIEHIPEKGRFQVSVEGELAVADYQMRGNEMLFTHTFVPPAARGKGIAEALVRRALEFAKEQSYKPVPLCSYVVTFLKRYPELA